MNGRNLIRRWLLPLSFFLGLSLLAVSIYLLTESTRSGGRLHEWRDEIYIVNVVAVIVLLSLVILNLIQLYRQYRRAIPGTRLTFNLLGSILPLVLIPLALMFYFSNAFSNDAVDSWFNSEVEEGLQQAFNLSEQSLQDVQDRYLEETSNFSSSLWGLYGDELNEKVNLYRARTNANQVTVFDRQGRVYANSVNDFEALFPSLPSEDILFQVERGTSGYAVLEEGSNGRLFLRTVVNVPQVLSLDTRRVLQADYALTDEVITLAGNAKDLYRSYAELTNYRTPLKQTFTLSLGLAFLAAMLGAVWAAIQLSRRIVRPMQELAEGTRQVADGDFSQKLAVNRNDEVGFLTTSFNRMTERLQIANDVAEQSQMLVEKERSNLATILAKLSTGVLSFDKDLCLRRSNQAAEQILDIDLYPFIEKDMGEIVALESSNASLFQQFIEDCWHRIESGQRDWRDEIALSTTERGRRVFVVACSSIVDEHDETNTVIVFDDVTRLVRAQRDAAWGEVARRLAHEIKNPLTPIQLSAERLEYRCADKLPEKEREILQRSTKTIIAQVDAMKSMVNAFRDYAQAPDLEIREFYLTDLLQDMITLYRPRNPNIELFSHFHETTQERIVIEADLNRLRQVMHNLFKNAYDALTSSLEANRISRGEIFLTTEMILQYDESNPQAEAFQFVRIVLMDNAGGFSEDQLGSLFEPYVTTKSKGTGLGLAIVRKIVEEHLGEIELSNHHFEDKQIGAKATILLPLDEQARLFTLTHGLAMRSVLDKITHQTRQEKQMSFLDSENKDL